MWTNDMQNLLEPLFQPIQDTTGKTYAFEALLRFRGHADSSPLSMVRRWEKTGFIRVNFVQGFAVGVPAPLPHRNAQPVFVDSLSKNI